MKEEITEIKKELSDIKSESLARELLQDARKQNKRMFIIWIITFVAFLGLLGYTIYLLNDISVVTQEVEQEGDSNNFIGRDGDING